MKPSRLTPKLRAELVAAFERLLIAYTTISAPEFFQGVDDISRPGDRWAHCMPGPEIHVSFTLSRDKRAQAKLRSVWEKCLRGRPTALAPQDV